MDAYSHTCIGGVVHPHTTTQANAESSNTLTDFGFRAVECNVGGWPIAATETIKECMDSTDESLRYSCIVASYKQYLENYTVSLVNLPFKKWVAFKGYKSYTFGSLGPCMFVQQIMMGKFKSGQPAADFAPRGSYDQWMYENLKWYNTCMNLLDTKTEDLCDFAATDSWNSMAF